jgi:hypothetical protein
MGRQLGRVILTRSLEEFWEWVDCVGLVHTKTQRLEGKADERVRKQIRFCLVDWLRSEEWLPVGLRWWFYGVATTPLKFLVGSGDHLSSGRLRFRLP